MTGKVAHVLLFAFRYGVLAGFCGSLPTVDAVISLRSLCAFFPSLRSFELDNGDLFSKLLVPQFRIAYLGIRLAMLAFNVTQKPDAFPVEVLQVLVAFFGLEALQCLTYGCVHVGIASALSIIRSASTMRQQGAVGLDFLLAGAHCSIVWFFALLMIGLSPC
eukprot:CAMPEP_0116570114 /NCGR_PEP_ID=MMETSP0397-20121206/16743_1 /TAXON_ID=216820 /ORGANISM="Cyclophora tenuis, Strain ECT3854" /LENGTH=161 /DNA_ID=CAMNT_0004097901 /DNA_START=451 /DNA_END=936 /DNA_ORIENTATION=-